MDTEYKIIGGDGVEYGPATLDELQAWIGEGRVAASTQVWRNDIAHWLPAARYLELHRDLERLHASVSPTYVAGGLRPVGFWPRLAAYLIDHLMMVMIFYGLLWVPLSNWQHWTLPTVPAVLNPQNFQQLVDQLTLSAYQMFPFMVTLILLYEVLLNGAFGATLGKMAIGSKIVCADGSRLSYGRALLRALAGQLTEVMFYWGYLWVAFRRDKRGMHDFIAGTKVVYSR